ncbi:MAG TPA: hypothetical protein PLL20_11755 [Phycisphaerae bacterium]|nr:hypothetical protein [Phycisphaerae bacterium]HRR83446.1 hypothetical protein [Phycisphaerae bacterium]
MRYLNSTLYSLAAPLAALPLPLMRMQFDNIGDYIRNMEPQLRQIIAEVIVAQISTIAEALIVALTRIFFGIGG